MKITYFGHSAFALQDGSQGILIDPFLSGNSHFRGKSLPKDLTISTIIATHGHGDHIGDAVALSLKHRAPIVAVAELAGLLAAKGCSTIACGVGGKIEHSWGWSRFVPACHSSDFEGKYAGNAVGVVCNIGGITVYHAGDTCLFGDMKLIGEMYKPDVALLPIGSCFTMDIYEATKAAEFLGAKTVIPMHYNTFPAVKADPEEYRLAVEGQGLARVEIMPVLGSLEF